MKKKIPTFTPPQTPAGKAAQIVDPSRRPSNRRGSAFSTMILAATSGFDLWCRMADLAVGQNLPYIITNLWRADAGNRTPRRVQTVDVLPRREPTSCSPKRRRFRCKNPHLER